MRDSERRVCHVHLYWHLFDFNSSLRHSLIAYVCDTSVCGSLNYRTKVQLLHPSNSKVIPSSKNQKKASVDDPLLPHPQILLMTLNSCTSNPIDDTNPSISSSIDDTNGSTSNCIDNHSISTLMSLNMTILNLNSSIELHKYYTEWINTNLKIHK